MTGHIQSVHLRALVLLAFALHACEQRPPPRPPSSAQAQPLGAPAWEHLKSALPGAWSMPTKSGHFVVSYKLISGGSALVEEWGEGTPHETETVFYPDHADLLLTHYCAQGNQPRLRVTSVSADAIVFRFVDATNLAPDQAMLVKRTLRIAGDAFEDTEVYRGPDGKEESTTYHFTRAAPGARSGPDTAL